MTDLPEQDWKKIRILKDVALNRLCTQILDKNRELIDAAGASAHTAYLAVYKLIMTENSRVAVMFDDIRRSNAIVKTAYWKAAGLVTDDEIAVFTDGTHEAVNRIAETV